MKTMTEQKRNLFMQYALEVLVEDYEAAEKESDRYFIKIRFLEYIEKLEENPSDVLNYMLLQEDKFMPFIAVLKDVNTGHTTSKKCSRAQERPVGKIKIVVFGEE